MATLVEPPLFTFHFRAATQYKHAPGALNPTYDCKFFSLPPRPTDSQLQPQPDITNEDDYRNKLQARILQDQLKLLKNAETIGQVDGKVHRSMFSSIPTTPTDSLSGLDMSPANMADENTNTDDLHNNLQERIRREALNLEETIHQNEETIRKFNEKVHRSMRDLKVAQLYGKVTELRLKISEVVGGNAGPMKSDVEELFDNTISSLDRMLGQFERFEACM
ncbi:hypothetical protein N0V83_003544 [Neocucurbitaria cava]|uniref:Uncharacterized protein n=1 Tax=Neocucurbitaria cava TaxID=798079 RepID=A0A9W8YBL4_9PLEO|nr:hypothetical protein N0V83_003544 [Neocucurbitaria cava]